MGVLVGGNIIYSLHPSGLLSLVLALLNAFLIYWLITEVLNFICTFSLTLEKVTPPVVEEWRPVFFGRGLVGLRVHPAEVRSFVVASTVILW